VSAFLALALGCAGRSDDVSAPSARRLGQEIFAAGSLFDVGRPVLTWLDEGGYDAYRTLPRFGEPERGEDGQIRHAPRYGTREIPESLRATVDPGDGWSLEELRAVVHQFVIHYDVAGTSRQCFKVLQDMRSLSVHFLLDVDGAIYQTLDLRERAWHAGTANGGSVGVEIAHIGAYTAPGHPVLRQWYDTDADGPFVRFPAWMTDTGIRTEAFVARPARPLLMTGRIHGRRLYQYDFTDEQYEALAHLVAAVHRALPRVRLDVPRAADGSVRTDVLSAEELAGHDGLLGHWHVVETKVDPGPAFDWERVLREARALVARRDSPKERTPGR
jgi:N-acetylmuramoyl-L-alanine amidase